MMAEAGRNIARKGTNFADDAFDAAKLQALRPGVGFLKIPKAYIPKTPQKKLQTVKNMFIFNKSSKEELHILMEGVTLQHCMFILLRQSHLPLSPAPGVLVHVHTLHP